MEEAKEILKKIYLKEYYDNKKTGRKRYVKISKTQLINFCIQLLETIENNQEK